ncbi:MAG TPA: cupin domain-containing protein [Firmicutes bacterium]|nr:cupin domain-containing protein [Bacillota bacterium]
MIKRSGEMPVEVRERMRDGQGKVELVHIMKQEDMKGKCRLFARLRLPEGASIGPHPHDNEEEIFYIIKGRAEVTEDGVKSILEPGDAVITGGGRTHSLANAGSEPLEVLAVILLY